MGLGVDASAASQDTEHKPKKNKKLRTQGGRFGFDDYKNAETVTHLVPGVHEGDRCTGCGIGKYYRSEPKKLLEFTGGPILTVTRHAKETWRCNCCGHEQVNHKKIEKWQPEARSAVIIHKMHGLPWHRMAKIQGLCGVPLAATTLWEQAKIVWEDCAKPVVSQLYELAAEGRLWCTDDTGNKILSISKANELLPEAARRACHTTVICAVAGQHKMVLYITANRYCRENWSILLAQRTATSKVIIMTDASNQSLPQKQDLEKAVSAVCLGSHAHRKFKDIKGNYPEICSYFTDLVSALYKHEHACEQSSPRERLEFHQENSTALIEAIYSKIEALFANKEVEPNSDLGKACQYWLNHKEGLTAFLRIEGVPLDNNWGERMLRVIAIYRNNSLFFKTLNSATVLNDLFSLVATCEENKVNAFAYLNWLQKNWKAVQANPACFLPWHFEQDTEAIVA